MPTFDYKAALEAGYNEDEILDHLSSSNPHFDVKGAFNSGYSLDEITQHLPSAANQPKEERTPTEKGARILGQYGLGALEGSPLGLLYDVGVMAATSKPALTFAERIRMGEDVEYLYEKNAGKPVEEWPEKDRALYESIAEQIGPGKELKNLPESSNLTIRGLAEKATGLDLHPEGMAEKAAQWTGFIKDPRKLFELAKTGLNIKDVTKAISPTGKDVLRGLGAGTALQMAEEGNYGPIGTLASAVIGDVGGNIAATAGKTVAKIVLNPREALAEVFAKFTKKDKLDLQKQIIKDFRDSGIQADIGTATDNDLVKWIQSRLAQSGLTGDALQDLSKTVKQQIQDEYKQIADSLGTSRFTTAHEAGDTARNFLKQIRDTDLAEVRGYYKEAESALKKNAAVNSEKVLNEINRIERSLKPGQVKSAEQKTVLDILETLKRDISDSTGQPIYASVKDLMNNKIALNDIVNYEVQGGQKQLLRGLISEIDRAIVSHGKDNPSFAKNYVLANSRFSNHSKTFRNKRVSRLLGEGNPEQILTKMNTVQGIKDIDKMVGNSAEGKQLVDSLKRFKLDRMIEDNLIDGVTQQVKLGTFSKLLDKGRNKEIIGELLPKPSLNRLKRLQKNAGKLADSAQKFLNTSKSGTTGADVVVLFKALNDLSNLLLGNPWPFLRTAGGVSGARYMTKLMGDPQFLKLVEDFILAAEGNKVSVMNSLSEKMIPLIRTAINQETNRSSTERTNPKQ